MPAGQSFSLTVQAEDQWDNPTTFGGTVTMKIATGPAGATLGGTLSTTLSSSGSATFSGLTLDTAYVGYILDATASGLTPGATPPITVTAAAASQLMIPTTPTSGQPPSTVTAGNTFPVIVDVEDQYGNLATGYVGSVTLALSGNTTGVITGNTANVSGGVATFSDVTIDTEGDFRLIGSTSGIVGATVKSNSITVNPGAPTQFAWVTQPQNPVIHNFGFVVSLQVEDQFGNVETADNNNASIVLSSDPAGGTLEGITTVPLSGGVALFSGLSINTIGNGYALTASTNVTTGNTTTTLSSAASDTFNVIATPAASLSVTAQPPSSTAVGSHFSFTVQALDEFGNPDPDFDGSIMVSIASGPSVPLGGSSMPFTASNGVATISGLFIDTVGTYTLGVSTTTAGVTSTTTDTFQIVADPATHLIVTGQPPAGLQAGALFGFTVTAEDQFDNVATGFTGDVSVSIQSGPTGATIGGPLTVAATAGVVNFGGLYLDKAGTNYILSVSSSNQGITGGSTDTFSVSPLAATQLVFSTEPLSTVEAGASFVVGVTAEDTYGNTATSFDGAIAIGLSGGPGEATLAGTLQMVAGQGVAGFTGLSITTAASGYTLSASSGNLVGGSSNQFTVSPASPVSLAVSITPPTVMTAGSLFGLAIAADDRYGNLATQFTGTVSIGLESNPANATLSGLLTANAVGGIANFHANITTIAMRQRLHPPGDQPGAHRRDRRPDRGSPGRALRPGRGHAAAFRGGAGITVRICRRHRRLLRQRRND